MAAVTAALVISAIAATASTVHSVESARQAARLAGQERDRQLFAQQDAEKKLQQRQANEAAMETSRQLKIRKLAQSEGAYTKGGSIQTTALGVQPVASAQTPTVNPRRTVLGE